MTLAELFLAVNRAGLRLTNAGGQLELRGPTEAITEEIRASAAKHQETLLALLSPATSPVAEADAPSVFENGFRNSHDWRDWRLEWMLEVGKLHLRMGNCRDGGVLARLRRLAETTPASLAEWLALGEQIVRTECELRRLGRLPPYPWPEQNPVASHDTPGVSHDGTL